MKNLILLLLPIFIACSNLHKESNYYFIKGLNYYQKNNKDEALKNYIKAYELNKKDIQILREIAYIYADMADNEKAKYYYQKALEIDINDKNSIENILNIFYLERNIEEFEVYLNKILDKNSLFYRYNYLKLLLLRNNYEEAFLYFQNIVQKNEYQFLDIEEFYKIYIELREKLLKEAEFSKEFYLVDKNIYHLYKDREKFFEAYINELEKNEEYSKMEEVLLEKIMTNENKKYLDLLATFYLKRKDEIKYRNIIKLIENKK